jgi:hypothetical protein
MAAAGGPHLPSNVDGRRAAELFTINGRSYPSTDVIKMRVGQTIKLRFIVRANLVTSNKV